jgi:hypothetical protein
MHGAHLFTLSIGDQQWQTISREYGTDNTGSSAIYGIGLTPRRGALRGNH